jgi:heme A synthase
VLRVTVAAPVRNPRYARFAWFVVAFNVVVIVWGALVRATGSGAGCGDHWPDCGGDIGSIEMIVELTHRLLTGVDGPLVIAMAVWGWRAFPAGHAVRRGAAWSLVLLVSEALIGAALVKLGYVKDNASPMRAVWMGGHLLNTNLMLAAMALTAWSAGAGARTRVRAHAGVAWAILGATVMALAAGMTGAVAALADTLFRASSLSAGFEQDAVAGAHLFLRLRALHPVVAVLAAAAGLSAASVTTAVRSTPGVKRAARMVRVALVLQVGAGLLNLVLLAPVAMQLVHLVLADAVWIALVLLGAEGLADATASEPSTTVIAAAAE